MDAGQETKKVVGSPVCPRCGQPVKEVDVRRYDDGEARLYQCEHCGCESCVSLDDDCVENPYWQGCD